MALFNSHRNLRRRLLCCEQLDPRITLDGTASAAAALPWFAPAELTYSFAPDGTSFGDAHSALFAELAETGTPSEWQSQFAQAFDEWLSILQVGIAPQADSGAPFGTFGPTQGDSRFGDIRIGAVPLSANVMAEAVPHSIITQGSWAGDILLNSNAEWSSLQQVYSVALHEFGHVLGLGHSDDAQSPMFYHGVYDVVSPTQADAASLLKLYAGVDLNSHDHESETHEHHSADHGGWQEEPHFEFDVAQAISLQAALSSTARYATSGSLSRDFTSVLYQLEPVGEIDHAEFMNVVVSAKQLNGLIPNVSVFDASGDRIRSRVLHNSEGVIVIQASDVEPSHTYYVAVTPAATETQNQIGEFDFFAEYSIPKLAPTKVGEYRLTASQPIVEQNFLVTSSRLVHVLVKSAAEDSRSAVTAVWGTLVGEDGKVFAQLAMNPGDSRSTPLVFLQPGNYTLFLQTGSHDGSAPLVTSLSVFVDEISIDIGPGVVDPATQPVIACQDAGADPKTCYDAAPIILINGPVFPDPTTLPPAPTYPSLPPWNSPTWFYWPAIVPTSSAYRHNAHNALDVSGDNLVSPLDVLFIVNELNATRPTGSTAYLDTNGDGDVSPIDVLLVINLLNSNLAASGEGPGQDADAANSLRDARTDQAIAAFWEWDLLRTRRARG